MLRSVDSDEDGANVADKIAARVAELCRLSITAGTKGTVENPHGRTDRGCRHHQQPPLLGPPERVGTDVRGPIADRRSTTARRNWTALESGMNE